MVSAVIEPSLELRVALSLTGNTVTPTLGHDCVNVEGIAVGACEGLMVGAVGMMVGGVDGLMVGTVEGTCTRTVQIRVMSLRRVLVHLVHTIWGKGLAHLSGRLCILLGWRDRLLAGGQCWDCSWRCRRWHGWRSRRCCRRPVMKTITNGIPSSVYG